MRLAWFVAELGVRFPDDLSVEAATGLLEEMAGLGPTRGDFPWFMARRLHALLREPEASFDYAALVLFCRGEAARRILHPRLARREMMLAALVEHGPQFVGIFFDHLRYYVEAALQFRRMRRMPDCVGPSLLAGAEAVAEGERELAARRRMVLHAVERASVWYERLMGILHCAPSLDERASGHELHHWVAGADMPGALRVRVEVDPASAEAAILPARGEAWAMLRAGIRPPAYGVPPWMVTMVEAGTGGRGSSAGGARGEHGAREAFAAEGERYGIAADWSRVVEKRTGEAMASWLSGLPFPLVSPRLFDSVSNVAREWPE